MEIKEFVERLSLRDEITINSWPKGYLSPDAPEFKTVDIMIRRGRHDCPMCRCSEFVSWSGYTYRYGSTEELKQIQQMNNVERLAYVKRNLTNVVKVS